MMFKLGIQALMCDINIGNIFVQSFVRHAAGFSGYNKPKRGSGEKFQRDDRWSHPRQDHSRQEADSDEIISQSNDKRQQHYEHGRNFKVNNSYFSHARNRPARSSTYYKEKKDQYKSENKTPNLLTWSDKQQIRMLNEQSPEQWTPDRLAGIFPATVVTVKKILSNRWQPQDIDKHDAAVLKHWHQLQSGQFKDLEPSLALHLQKFLPEKAEDQEPVQVQAIDAEVANQETVHEQNQERNTMNVIENSQEKSDISVIKTRKNKTIAKYNTKKVSVQEQELTYPERIKIPEDKWKEGATYKVGDAYYHSDGTFLYRVPGITE